MRRISSASMALASMASALACAASARAQQKTPHGVGLGGLMGKGLVARAGFEPTTFGL